MPEVVVPLIKQAFRFIFVIIPLFHSSLFFCAEKGLGWSLFSRDVEESIHFLSLLYMSEFSHFGNLKHDEALTAFL